MSSPEVERFEITDEDLQNEFNPYRKQFRMSKNKATYGIWADDSDEEERPSFGGSGKGSKNYTAPVSFISGGIKVGDKTTKQVVDDDGDHHVTDSDEEAEQMPKEKPKTSRVGFQGGKHRQGSGIGDWERHTKGIGQHLLEKMGHVPGRGLGKDLQGISAPVEAFKRKGKAALGFYGTERTEQSLKDYPNKPDSEEEDESEFRSQLHQWRRIGEEKKKPKYVYKTADELIAMGSRKKVKDTDSALAKVKVIDMTGKEKRVLSGYHAISQKHDRPSEIEDETLYSQLHRKKAFDMPELLHNLDLLVELAEDEILQNERKLVYERDVVVNVNFEREKNSNICVEEEENIERLKQVLSLIESLEPHQPTSEPLSLADIANTLTRFQDEFYEEYHMYNLSTLAVALVFPMMEKEFKDWDPLQSPRHGAEMVRHWKSILADTHRTIARGQADMDPYEKLLWDVWMPYTRTAVCAWSVRSPDQLLELLETWFPLMPNWMQSNVLQQLILPRLQSEVDNWNPLTDTMPIHAWLHPWLPLMADRLEPLYAPIRHKLANALKNWHPSDPSAKLILQPWVGVFRPGHMDAFLVKNIVPKLALCLQEFVINPHMQHLDAWTWVIMWVDVIPLPHFVSLLEKCFFDKWLQVLCTWLSSSANYDEVTKWYMGWKAMFPEKLLSSPIIKDQFNRALDLMNRAVSGHYQPGAVSGHYQPGARENIAYLMHTERNRTLETQATTRDVDYREMVPAVRNAAATAPVVSEKMSFREVLETKAAENQLLYMPVPNKTYEAKQVYKFGNVHIYIDRNVVFMMENFLWKPVSMNTLLEKAR